MFKKTNKKGFTLIELIVVVAIMAILVALLAPNVLKYIEKTKVGKDQNSLDSVRLAIEAELMDERLSSYSTGSTTSGTGDSATTTLTAEWLYDFYSAKSNDSTASDMALLGYRLFGDSANGDGDVLDEKFAYGASGLTQEVFSSKAADNGHIQVIIDGKGGVAVLAINAEGTVATYDGDPIYVATKIDLGTFTNGAFTKVTLDQTSST